MAARSPRPGGRVAPAMRALCFSASLFLAACAGNPAPEQESFPSPWIDGTDSHEPLLQVHRFGSGMWIMRQSVLTHYEAPFMYLYVGRDRALLIDTGAGGVPVRAAVDELLARRRVDLIVAHSHAHGDHTAGDADFAGREDTVVVGHSPREVWDAFGLGEFGEGVGEIDLGGRVLDVMAIPGHELSSIAVYDRRSRTLMTGDTVYPGRLYVRDWPLYVESLRRLVAWCDTHPVSWVVGTHIEMTAEPGVDYPRGAAAHPDERRLELTPDHLRELLDACEEMGDHPWREVHDDFVIVPPRSRG